MRAIVIDYKAGNLTSVLKSLRHLGSELAVTDGDLALVESAERLILPGVGHFAATKRLDDAGLTAAIRAAVARGVPFLGICVGMQWLYSGSTEAPEQPGLAQFSERCTRFSESGFKVPHVGWNSLDVRPGSRLLAGVEPGEYVYFTHSYKAPVTPDTAASTHYIQPFAAAVKATYETLKALREGVPPAKLQGVADAELMKRVTRDADYTKWTKDFLGG